MENSKSTFVSILRRICAEEKIELNAYAYDWVFCLKKGARSRYLYGYKFPINDAASASLCDDKGALSEVLEQNGVAHIPHTVFLSPADRHYVGGQGDEKDMLALLRQYGSDAVIKPNFGTGGYDVCRVRSEEELRRGSAEIFKSSSALAMSPYVEILQEYRAVMLDGTLELLFEKKRPQVEGNGTDTVAQLAAAQLGDGSVCLPPKAAEQIPARGKPCCSAGSIISDRARRAAIYRTTALYTLCSLLPPLPCGQRRCALLRLTLCTRHRDILFWKSTAA